MNKIETMLRLQQQLNDATNGTGWEKGITKNGKQIDWRRCIWLEAAELVESYPWKHWKNIAANPDYANIKIEAVDIWHFVMSEALRVYAVEGRGDIADLATDAPSAAQLVSKLREESIHIGAFGDKRIRIVTHLDVNAQAADNLITALSNYLD